MDTDLCPTDNIKLSSFDVNAFLSKIIDGKYQIQSLLGLGGMGAVFRARHTFINNDVAIKLINPQLSNQPEIAERFLREARAAALIDHPNSVKVTDFGRTDDMLYLVMEYIPGYSLANLIRKKKRLSPATVGNIMMQIAAAIDDAHSRKIIHRDLKPDNIMIKVDRGRHMVKVFDFGIAKMMVDQNDNNAITRAGTIVGTLNYMSPEQCRGDNFIDSRSDIYSLGVVAFEMLTGRLPFTAPNPTGVAVKHIVDPPPAPSKVHPELPISIDEVILKCLQKDPNARYRTATEFATCLAEAASNAGLTEFDAEFPPVTGASTGDNSKLRTSLVQPATETAATLMQSSPVPANEQELAANINRRKFLYAAGGAAAATVFSAAGYFFFRKVSERTPAPPDSQQQDSRYPGMVLIKSGWLRMGSNSKDAFDSEKPVHEVFINDFYLDVTPVTNEQFEKFTLDQGYVTQAEQATKTFESQYPWRKYYNQYRRKHPVVSITWNDAVAYAKWAKKRLPTEAEWEYAARGGLIGKDYPWGNDPPTRSQAIYGQVEILGNAFVINADSSSKEMLPTVPVDSHDTNGYGLRDMVGNVRQWCSDWYDERYYQNSTSRNPQGPLTGTEKVLRGGSWGDEAPKLRVYHREGEAPDRPYILYGFRCARNVD
jgi:eukaryotic-like serine/threonine-protein kinase